MANYSILKTAIADYVKDRTGLDTIDGDGLQETLLAMVNSLGANYQYAGVAKLTPTQTNPGSPDANVFYIATEPGTYTNFVGAGGSLVVADGEVAIFKYNGTWSKEVTGAATAAQVTELGQYLENPEWVKVVTDSEDKILYGVKTDGKFYFGDGCPPQVVAYVAERIVEIANDLGAKVDKESGKSLIDALFASSQSVVENPEWIEVKTDSENKVLEGISIAGKRVVNLPIVTPSAEFASMDNKEWVQVYTDNDGKILCGLRKNGKLYISGLDTTPKELIDYFNGKDTRLRVSVLGDSISTFKQENYYVHGYSMYYPSDRDDVNNVNDTWWKQVINQLGGRLEINVSSSGSTASSRLIGFTPRTQLLGNPDMILVELGTNDWFNNVPIGTINYDEQSPDLSKFAPAYIDGIKHLIELYPTAKIVCVSFTMSDDYANVIAEIASHYGCTYIDVRNDDGVEIHPDKAHMFKAAGKVLSILSSGLNYLLNYTQE